MYNIEDAVIIGITGRVGKTSTAYLVHEYLKAIGKKSILYSSAKIDSPCTNWSTNIGLEFTYTDLNQIVQTLHEAVAYEAEFIILECWEQSILCDLFEEIPFDLKVMTKFYYTGNGHRGAEMVYNNKLKFFKDEQDAKCLINVVNYDPLEKSQIAKFVSEMNASNVVLMDSVRIDNCKSKSDYINHFNTSSLYEDHRKYLNVDDIKYTINSFEEQATESKLNINLNGVELSIETPLISGYHIENITTAAAILNEVGALNTEYFKVFLADQDLEVPGRMEAIQWRDRTIIIDNLSDFALNAVKRFKADNPVKAVVGYKVIESIFNENFRISHPDRTVQDGLQGWDRDPMIINELADYAYITVGGLGRYTAEELTSTFADKTTIPHEVILDRKEAIKKALLDSEENDIICILRRGGESHFIRSYDKIEFFKDRELLDECIEEIEESEKETAE